MTLQAIIAEIVSRERAKSIRDVKASLTLEGGFMYTNELTSIP